MWPLPPPHLPGAFLHGLKAEEEGAKQSCSDQGGNQVIRTGSSAVCWLLCFQATDLHWGNLV